MKLVFLTLALMLSNLSFAQSMIVLKTGKVLTIDDQGMLFDLGNFLAPYQIKEMRGRYIIDENRKLRTVDRSGFMYSKEEESKLPVKIETFGENYFISKFGRIFTVDEQGFMFEAESKEKEFRNILNYGGNFFVAEKREDGKKLPVLFAVTSLGRVVEVKVPGLAMEKINYVGGQYFTTSGGELFTVSADGYVYSKKDMGRFNGWELKKGGNYFVAHGSLYTVAQSGIVMSAAIAADIGMIKHYGTNFFITYEGRLYTVSASGALKNIAFDEKLSNISHFSHL